MEAGGAGCWADLTEQVWSGQDLEEVRLSHACPGASHTVKHARDLSSLSPGHLILVPPSLLQPGPVNLGASLVSLGCGLMLFLGCQDIVCLS